MKKTIMALALALGILAAGAAATPTQARADHQSTYSYRHCGHCQAVVHYEQVWVEPVYRTQTVFVGYDHCGNPVYRNQTVCVQRGYYRNVPVTRYVCGGGERRERRWGGGGFRFDFRF